MQNTTDFYKVTALDIIEENRLEVITLNLDYAETLYEELIRGIDVKLVNITSGTTGEVLKFYEA